MSLLAPLGLAAAAALPLIVLLYFLKVRRPEVRVATLVLWTRHLADRQANAPWQRLRWSALLVLQLLAALLVTAALTRPGLTGAAGVGKTTVVLLDASASMRATDTSPDRFRAAVDRARAMVSGLAPGQQMAIVLMGEHAQLLAAPTSDGAVLDGALARAQPSSAASDLGQGMSLASAILAGRPGGSIVLLGDGHSRAPSAPPRVNAPLTYISIGSADQNAGIEALKQTGPGSVFVQVSNYGRAPRDLRLEMRVDGRLADVVPLHVEGNASASTTWTRLPAGSELLEVHLTPGDFFSLDDSAWLLTGSPPQHSVLLVTDGNAFLQRALALRPGVKVTVVSSRDYRPGDHDLYVFDGWVPPGKLPTPALVVGTPGLQGPVPLGGGLAPGGVLPPSPREPLLQDVVLRDVHVQVAARAQPAAGWRTVFGGTDAPLLLVHEGEPRMAEFTFDLHHSDLPLRSAFPILVQNLLGYLLPGGFENQAFALGQPVPIATEPGAIEVDVTTPDGRVDRLRAPVPSFTDTGLPGVYTVRQQLAGGSRVSRFVVEFHNPALSRIAPGAAAISLEDTDVPRAPGPRGILELWPWIAGVLLALVAAEWLLYLRGG